MSHAARAAASAAELPPPPAPVRHGARPWDWDGGLPTLFSQAFSITRARLNSAPPAAAAPAPPAPFAPYPSWAKPRYWAASTALATSWSSQPFPLPILGVGWGPPVSATPPYASTAGADTAKRLALAPAASLHSEPRNTGSSGAAAKDSRPGGCSDDVVDAGEDVQPLLPSGRHVASVAKAETSETTTEPSRGGSAAGGRKEGKEDLRPLPGVRYGGQGHPRHRERVAGGRAGPSGAGGALDRCRREPGHEADARQLGLIVMSGWQDHRRGPGDPGR